MRFRPGYLLFPLCLLALVACGQRDRDPDPEPQPDPVAEIGLAEAVTVIAARGGDEPPTPRDLVAAEKAVAEALEDEWPADDDPAWITAGLLPHELGLVVCQRHAEQTHAVRLALIDPDEECAWRRQLELGSNFTLESGELIEIGGLPQRVLALELDNPNATADHATHLVYALATDGALLIRVEDADGDWAAARLHGSHPNLGVDFGKLHSERIDFQLAALVALSQPAQKELRHDSKIRSTLEALAGSVDNTWLAEAAAQVLTLP